MLDSEGDPRGQSPSRGRVGLTSGCPPALLRPPAPAPAPPLLAAPCASACASPYAVCLCPASRVNQFMETYYSQNGEDRTLNALYRNRRSGTCIEVGAHDGIHLSNTYYFEQLGWRCVLVEPNADLCARIRQNRKAVLFACAASDNEGVATLLQGSDVNDVYSTLESANTDKTLSRNCVHVAVKTKTLTRILAEAGVDCIDFISIDVEGHELAVLQGLDLTRWTPSIIVVEDNSNFADDRVSHHLGKHSYYRFWRTGPNDWYAHKRLHRVQLLSQLIRTSCFSWRGLIKGNLKRTLIRRIVKGLSRLR